MESTKFQKVKDFSCLGEIGSDCFYCCFRLDSHSCRPRVCLERFNGNPPCEGCTSNIPSYCTKTCLGKINALLKQQNVTQNAQVEIFDLMEESRKHMLAYVKRLEDLVDDMVE